MYEVIPLRLWLGHARDARDPGRILEMGVHAVVDLAKEELPAQLNREMIYVRFPLLDGSGNRRELLLAAIDATASLIRQDIPTLVCCGAGMSRSPAILAAALARVRNQSPDDCLRDLAAGHPHDVSSSLWVEVKDLYQ